MITALYQRISRPLLLLVLISTPFLWYQASKGKSNNDIETWLPRNTPVRARYEDFKRNFGLEEVIVVGVSPQMEPRLVEAVAKRIETTHGVGAVWTPTRMIDRMGEFGVDADEARRRVTGLLVGEKATLDGIMVVLNHAGTADRSGVVQRVREVLDYCRLQNPEAFLTGAAVVVTELDRLGSPQASIKFFGLTVVICLGLLQYSIGHWRMSLSLLGVTLWSIYLTQATVKYFGGEMNFIMGALSVMVMTFTLSIAVHFLDYYSAAKASGAEDPLRKAMKDSLAPCLWSTLTTLLGLLSLNISSIGPVNQFGFATAFGATVAVVVGLGITPALCTIWPACTVQEGRMHFDFHAWGGWIGRHRWRIFQYSMAGLVLVGIGISMLEPKIDPVDFLPRNSIVTSDLKRVDSELTSVNSIEAVIDFGLTGSSFVERLKKVQEWEGMIRAMPGVRHTFSVADFFPKQLPDSPTELGTMLGKAQSQQASQGYLAQQQRLWRISVRIQPGVSPAVACSDLEKLTAGLPIEYTGVSPLLVNAQNEIFTGFWQSFTGAVGMISIVMVVALRSFKMAALAMIPNILPIWLVFGLIGYAGVPVDIGMMMTGSIAIGISVDCTFHFLVAFREKLDEGGTPIEACQAALEHSGRPLVESTFISAVSMLALCLSSFRPTCRFGWMMSAQMLASLLGELVLLPVLLCLFTRAKKKTKARLESQGHAHAVRRAA
ncbi:efflux RND transporter permease subunit [Planctomyces sp. SH-PL14]|uniref:efflux RND transporter permease subunit n=1 Tax=Planctomyces sp. SH-PL14 TaxID=1632864 RepID=UPI00078ECF43|nr:MMPL family transporter [Planctomyces sp. SH-PL14]AMV21160.1 MMPL family protein [Planctomyces sp. SH-PL14]